MSLRQIIPTWLRNPTRAAMALHSQKPTRIACLSSFLLLPILPMPSATSRGTFLTTPVLAREMATQITVEFNDQVPLGVEVEETAVDEEIEEVEEAGIKTATPAV